MGLAVSSDSVASLAKVAREIRATILRAVFDAGKGHLGGSLSIVEILVAIYFGGFFKLAPGDVESTSRSRFILSKGHAAVALYAILARVGFIDAVELGRINRGFLLAEHPGPHVPGIEFLSGSLGHGLSLGAGVALGEKMNSSESSTLVLLGDGECYEGPVWEAAQFAAHHHLASLCAIVDRNGMITHGSTEEINSFGDLAGRWRSFGWNVVELDGHDLIAVLGAFRRFAEGGETRPTVILANTRKGAGVSFMEGKFEWHHGGLTLEQLGAALAEVEAADS